MNTWIPGVKDATTLLHSKTVEPLSGMMDATVHFDVTFTASWRMIVFCGIVKGIEESFTICLFDCLFSCTPVPSLLP